MLAVFDARANRASARTNANYRKAQYLRIADEIATFYAIQGDRDQALEWLDKAVKMGAPELRIGTTALTFSRYARATLATKRF